MKVNIPWQELAIGANPCPKCGKTDPHYRHSAFYKETDAVCCGGEGCGFYQGNNYGRTTYLYNNVFLNRVVGIMFHA